jgi:hypothetical protein
MFKNSRTYITYAVKNATIPNAKKCSDVAKNISKTSPKKEKTKASIVSLFIDFESDLDAFINKKMRLITIADLAV